LTKISTLRAQVDKHQRDNSKISLQLVRLQEEMQTIVTNNNEEISELQSRATSQMKTIREQFESDRLALRMTIDKITKEKIDLQAEVGQLLRDRIYPNSV
jgi:membrane protease subunit (stomatin/prohibitin family)